MTPERSSIEVDRSMEERVKEFRKDPEKMDVTTKFVNEVVEKAKIEALKRIKEREKGKEKIPHMSSEGGGRKKRGRWHSRARGFFSRLFASLCFCSTQV